MTNKKEKPKNKDQDSSLALETTMAFAPVPRGMARITLVEDSNGRVIHARRWYAKDGEMRASRDGFTVIRADDARTLAKGLLAAADVLDSASKA